MVTYMYTVYISPKFPDSDERERERKENCKYTLTGKHSKSTVQCKSFPFSVIQISTGPSSYPVT